MGYVIAAGADREIYAASAKEALRLYRMTRRAFGLAAISDGAGRVVSVGELSRNAEREIAAQRDLKRRAANDTAFGGTGAGR